MQGGGGPAEPTAERHPQSDPGEKLTIAIEQSVLTDDVKSNAKVREPAPVRASETGRARNWTMPPLRLERECKERPNSATIDNRCVEFDRRESTESTAIIGLRALGRRIAFTMAEILLSLTIIGVVAAITLPSLTGNINERTWNTQRKALYARFSQAIALMPALNGYGTYSQDADSAGSVSVTDTAAETFVTSGLSKVLKINNICDKDHVFDCGFASKITTLAASQIVLPRKLSDLNGGIPAGGTSGFIIYDTNAAAFETANGESILAFYNPNCVPENVMLTGHSDGGYSGYYIKQQICANFVFDLNGSKGPNTVGKDIGFMSVAYPSDSVVVMPFPTRILDQEYSQPDAAKACRELDSENRLPNIEELISMYYNKKLIDWSADGSMGFWSATVEDRDNAWTLGAGYGMKYLYPKETLHNVQCVKR